MAQPAGAASPTAVLEAFFDGANAILKTVDPFGDLETPRQAVRDLVYEVFDFRGASALALGPAWLSRTPDEQEEFVRLFAVFLERGFIGMIGSKASVSDGVKIQFVDESVGEDWAGVATSLLSRSGQELPVDYWFVRRGERWKIQDVVIDGVSLIANYRSQFTRVLAAYPYSEVLARLGASQSNAPTLVAAPAPQIAGIVPVAPAVPRIQPPPAGTALSPKTFQEIHLTALPSEVSSSERVRASVAARVSEIRERSGPARGQAGFIAGAHD